VPPAVFFVAAGIPPDHHPDVDFVFALSINGTVIYYLSDGGPPGTYTQGLVGLSLTAGVAVLADLDGDLVRVGRVVGARLSVCTKAPSPPSLPPPAQSLRAQGVLALLCDSWWSGVEWGGWVVNVLVGQGSSLFGPCTKYIVFGPIAWGLCAGLGCCGHQLGGWLLDRVLQRRPAAPHIHRQGACVWYRCWDRHRGDRRCVGCGAEAEVRGVPVSPTHPFPRLCSVLCE
jgi:hypothetical protein